MSTGKWAKAVPTSRGVYWLYWRGDVEAVTVFWAWGCLRVNWKGATMRIEEDFVGSKCLWQGPLPVPELPESVPSKGEER